MSLRLRPITLADAKTFVREHHRHNLPPLSWKFGVAVEDADEQIVGVAIAGRPVARKLDARKHEVGRRLEVTRTCTTGARNANSMLYGAVCRAAAALGYSEVITYTLPEESGSSLRAAGFEVDAVIRPPVRGWETRPGRPELDDDGNPRRPAGPKIRWKRSL